MKVSQLVINSKETFGEEFFLTGVKPNSVYEDGKKTGVNGIKVEVACPKLSLDKFEVKILNCDPEKFESFGNMEKIKFTELDTNVCQDFSTGQIKVSATAKKFDVIQGA